MDSSLGGTGGSLAGLEASVIKGKIAPSTVVTINGEKIGIVGATTWDLLTKTSPNGTIVKDDGNAFDGQAARDRSVRPGRGERPHGSGREQDRHGRSAGHDRQEQESRPARIGHRCDGRRRRPRAARRCERTAFPFNGHSDVGDYPQAATALDGKPMLIVTTDTEYTYLGRLVVGFDSSGVLDATSLDSIVNGAYAASEPTLQSVYGTSDPASSIVAASPTGAKIKAISVRSTRS